ncbi:hypothetical protein [Nostoc sp. 'Peltigera membranacea cyanobiont' N6]|nr:hypothetical protein [Nostoc sp. 'Peltigera membranacea cyanobiont' N6]
MRKRLPSDSMEAIAYGGRVRHRFFKSNSLIHNQRRNNQHGNLFSLC